MRKDNMYTPEMAGSGQYGICAKCKKPPTKDGHDGCTGTLPNKWIMNACCGHGLDDRSYIQFWNSPKLIGQKAIDYINKNKSPKAN